MITNTCKRCGREFESPIGSKACSNACRNKLWLDNNPDKRQKAREYSRKYNRAKKAKLGLDRYKTIK